jgi:CRP-like cAMP-binding protein
MSMVNPVTRLPALRPVPIFRGLSKAALLQVARKSVEVSYPVGAVVVRQGDPGDSLCIIVSGTVEVRHNDRVVAVLSRGDFFGEISLIDGKPRTASVVAVDDVVVLTLRAADFDSLLNDPYVARAALKSLAERFRTCQDSLSPTEV